MPMIVRWYYPNHVLYIQMAGDFVIEDATTGNQTILNLLEQTEADTVHLLVDRTQIRGFPSNLSKFVRTMTAARHPKIGHVIGYGQPSRLVDTITVMAARLIGVNYRKFMTEAEALEFLTQITTPVNQPKNDGK